MKSNFCRELEAASRIVNPLAAVEEEKCLRCTYVLIMWCLCCTYRCKLAGGMPINAIAFSVLLAVTAAAIAMPC